MIVRTINKANTAHLAKVTSEMQVMGAPTIRVVDMGNNAMVALEGSHRIAAAVALGLEPNFVAIDPDTKIADTDLADQFDWAGINAAAADIAMAVWADNNCPGYRF